MSRKCIGVKAKQNKKVEDVLRPILQQYGWNLDHMNVQVQIDREVDRQTDRQTDKQIYRSTN